MLIRRIGYILLLVISLSILYFNRFKVARRITSLKKAIKFEHFVVDSVLSKLSSLQDFEEAQIHLTSLEGGLSRIRSLNQELQERELERKGYQGYGDINNDLSS